MIAPIPTMSLATAMVVGTVIVLGFIVTAAIVVSRSNKHREHPRK